ncbi:hypothetical protein [Hyalangium gracile]|uniref:hypothetical protein n=1 Tax=Hyalangium gracile TaxID=394092 RepID=UPI001CCC25FB|nr:hypothetical protein [Hyalangium gracile]
MLAVFLPRLVLADCFDWNVSVWPPLDRRLPANGQLVIEGYGELQEQVSRIAERSPRLVSDEEEVHLNVIAVYRGEKRLTQAVLQPERPLKPGMRYTLRLTRPVSAKIPVLRPEISSRGDEILAMAWTVSPADLTPPRWHEAPRATGQKVVHFGCGPAIHVDVSAAVEDERSQVQILAEVKRAEGGEPVRFRLTPSMQQVRIGHGMCSGGFELQEGVRYSVRLMAVDMAGNESAAPGGELLIQGPEQ